MKRCTKCGADKPLDEFGRDARARDGRKSRCKACDREYYRENADRYREYKREYRRENADKRREYDREYRRENADRIRERKREYYRENAGRFREYSREYYRENADRYREYKREYRRENADRLREYDREWARNNPDKRAAKDAKRRAIKNSAAHEQYDRVAIFARWGHACAYCDAEAEHLDHITAISRGGADAEWNLIPACGTCNSSKGAKTLAEWAETF